MDLHGDRYNAELGEDGFIKILEDCGEEELYTRYSSRYNWDELKQRVLTSLKEEIKVKFPGYSDLIPSGWSSLKGGHDHINRWVKRMIEGNLIATEKHGICGWSANSEEQSTDDLMCFLTFGPTMHQVQLHTLGAGPPNPRNTPTQKNIDSPIC